MDISWIILLLCMAIFARLGGCDNNPKHMESRLERIENKVEFLIHTQEEE